MMRGRPILLAAGLLLAAATATPAAAAKFVFDVTVTGLDDPGHYFQLFAVDVQRFDSFTAPFSFRETIDISLDQHSISTTFIPNTNIPLLIDDVLQGSADWTATPMTAGLLGLSGFTEADLTGTGLGESKGGITGGLEQARFSLAAVGGSYQNLVQYGRGLSVLGGHNPALYAPMDVDQVKRILGAYGPIRFSETAFLETSGYDAEGFLAYDHVDFAGYVGTAVFRPDLTGAPEPAAWSLMIAGFCLAGAALRRRRGLAVAS